MLCYNTALAFTKVSISILYLSIFTLEWSRRACYVLLALVTISSVWSVVSIFTNTIPLEATWDWRVTATHRASDLEWWVIVG